MRRLLIPLLLVLAFLAIAAPSCNVPNSPGKKWEIRFDDEFDDAVEFLGHWNACGDYNYGACTGTYLLGREWYNASQIWLDTTSSAVALVAQQGTDPNCSQTDWPGNCQYRSGQLTTARPSGTSPNSAYKYKFTYGYVEARVQMPYGTPGFFGAVWLLPACKPSCSDSFGAEYDVTEYLSGASPFPANTSWMAAYGPPNKTTTGQVDASLQTNGACPHNTNLATGFHTYGLDWKPTYVAWYLDGVKCGQFNHATFNQPMYLIANLTVDPGVARPGGCCGPNASLPSPYNQVGAMLIDYVKVWQEVPA